MRNEGVYTRSVAPFFVTIQSQPESIEDAILRMEVLNSNSAGRSRRKHGK